MPPTLTTVAPCRTIANVCSRVSPPIRSNATVESRENRCESLLRVVDDHVSAKLSHQRFPTGRSGRRDLVSEVLGDLYGEAAHATSAPGDEDALPTRNMQFIAQRLQRGEPGKWNGGGVRKVEARGYCGHCDSHDGIQASPGGHGACQGFA